MAAKPLPSPEVLRQLLRYDAETGNLFWRPRPLGMFPTARAANSWNARYAGREAFIKRERDGYLRGSIFCDLFLAHRVIWAMETGSWPPNVIDHINGVADDNRLSNLRVATQAQNMRNLRRHKDGKSAYLGVCWHRVTRKWAAAITTDYRTRHLGLFASEIDAAKAYDTAAKKSHGIFAHTNFGDSA